MSADQYLNLKGTFDRLRGPKVDVGIAAPVALMADLSVFAAELFEPRAIVIARANNYAGQFWMKPVGGAGLVIEEFTWITGGPSDTFGFNIEPPPVSTVIGNTARVDIGGQATRFETYAGNLIQSPSFDATWQGNDGQLLPQQRIFVPAGDYFHCGFSGATSPESFYYQLTVREVRDIPVGLV